MSPSMLKLSLAILAVLILVTNTLFIVPQAEQAIVTQFGQVVRVVDKPGLWARVPFIQSVNFFDRRILDFTTQPAEFITRDPVAGIDERVVIDAFVRWRITDPVKFFQAVKTEANLTSRLNSIVLSTMRRTLGDHSLSDLLSDQRAKIMAQIRDEVNAQTRSVRTGTVLTAEQKISDKRKPGFGIEVVDVRIMRADLPLDISEATYERMRKNFTKEAQLFRAQGDEQATKTRASADRQKIEILAEARKQSETIRGEGDGEAAKIYAAAFGRDPEFFRFYRSMQAYKKALSKDDTTFVLGPDNAFLHELDPK